MNAGRNEVSLSDEPKEAMEENDHDNVSDAKRPKNMDSEINALSLSDEKSNKLTDEEIEIINNIIKKYRLKVRDAQAYNRSLPDNLSLKEALKKELKESSLGDLSRNPSKLISIYKHNRDNFELIVETLAEDILSNDTLKKMRSLDWGCFYKTFERLYRKSKPVSKNFESLIETCSSDCICLDKLRNFVGERRNPQEKAVKDLLEDKFNKINNIFTEFNKICEDTSNANAIEEIKVLVKDNLDARDRYGDTLLHCAVKHSRLDVFKWLLDNGADVNAVKGKTTLLHTAVRRGNLDVVSVLLEKNPGLINRVDEYKKTPLHYAVEKGQTDIVNALLGIEGIDVNIKDSRIEAPLHIAAKNGNLTIVNALLGTKGIDVDIKYGYEQDAPLHIVAKLGHLDIVNALLAHGAYFNIKNRYGCTPLHYAAEYGHLVIVNALLGIEGIDVNIKDRYGCTPLHIAAKHGRLDVVKALLEKNPELINIVDDLQKTALHHAVENGHTNVVKLLLDAAGDNKLEYINKVNKSQETALHLAAWNGDTDIIKLLLDAAGDNGLDYINIVNESKETALHLAAKRDKIGVAKLLLDVAGDNKLDYINKVDNEGKNALHNLAIYSNMDDYYKDLSKDLNLNFDDYLASSISSKPDFVTLLLDAAGYKKLDYINKVDNEGKNALHHAGIHCHKIYELLLLNGVSYSIKDKNGKIPSKCKEIFIQAKKHVQATSTKVNSASASAMDQKQQLQ